MLEVFNSVLSIITSSGEANPGMTSTGGLWLGFWLGLTIVPSGLRVRVRVKKQQSPPARSFQHTGNKY